MTTRLKSVNVVVIGVGWAGSIMATELTRAGLSVVGLESGGPRNVADFMGPSMHDELGNQEQASPFADLSKRTVTFRNSLDETARPVRRHGAMPWADNVGGGGIYWAANCYRLTPWDFKVRSNTIERYGAKALPEDCTSQDWPMSYEDMEPYYDKFERMIGAAGKAGNLNGTIVAGGNPFEGPRAHEYPNPAAPYSYEQSMFVKATADLGYHPFPIPRATMTRVYTNPDGLTLNACTYCGHCGSYACEMNAKASPQLTLLPTALASGKFELRPRSVVTRINLDSTGKQARSVTYVDAAGQEFEQPADIVILSAFTFANVRLLLASQIGIPYDPHTGKGAIGRNFTWHNHITPAATLFFDEGHVFNYFMGSGGYGARIFDFQGDNFDHTGLGFIGGAAIGVVNEGRGILEGAPVPPGTPAFGSAWKKAVAHYASRSVEMTGQHDNQGHRGNYLDLDPTYRDGFGIPMLRITYDNKENEKKADIYLHTKMAEIARAMGASSVEPRGLPEHVDFAYRGSIHQSGGAICGSSPENSAVNGYLQCWQTHNLFVVGATALPQLPSLNPTLPVGALAYRAAEAITQRYVKSPQLLA